MAGCADKPDEVLLLYSRFNVRYSSPAEVSELFYIGISQRFLQQSSTPGCNCQDAIVEIIVPRNEATSSCDVEELVRKICLNFDKLCIDGSICR